MGCCEFIVKYILFFVNLFFALAGLALLGVGVAFQLKITVVTDLMDGSFNLAPITAMVTGGIVFLIAFFGCCGAIKENNCMLVVYAIFMLILMALKVTLAIMIFVNLDSVVKDVPNWTNRLFTTDKNAFHDIERGLQCCGTTGWNSYGFDILNLPASCCASSPCLALNAFDGCIKVIEEFINTFGMLVGIFAITIGALELVTAVFALCLASKARNRDRRAHY